MKIGGKIYSFEELDSTNEFAKTLRNPVEGTVIVADKQVQGKGRLGKNWYSPEGGLWFSIILKPDKQWQCLSLVIGVAVCKALISLNIKTNLKWPNDILIGTKKVGGILTEIKGDTAIVGIGLNVNVSQFPQELKEFATSILLETNKTFDKKEILEILLRAIEKEYSKLINGEIKDLLDEWREYSVTLGKFVEIKTPVNKLQGKSIDIDKNGALLLELPSGKIEKILAGECTIINGKND